MPKKPLGIKNYGSIPHLSGSKLGPADHFIDPGQERILTERVRDRHDYIIVTEKYDGTNVGIAKHQGQIIALQRKGYLARDSPYEQHQKFADYVAARQNIFQALLSEGDRIVGEWLWQASGIHYGGGFDPFQVFDYFTDRQRIAFDDLEQRLEAYPISLVRVLYRGPSAKSIAEMMEVLHTLGTVRPIDGQLPEGMVFRAERRGVYDFMAKWVRADFEPGRYLPGIGLPPDAELVLNECSIDH